MKIEIGQVYKHFKGTQYRIIGLGTDTETNQPVVIYRAIQGDLSQVWVRPASMWFDMKVSGGKLVPRFELIVDNW